MISDDKFRKQVVDACQPSIGTLEDGFLYFFTKQGAFSADSLRVIADELDRLNDPWKQRIDQELNSRQTLLPTGDEGSARKERNEG